jgi:glutaredoxin
MNKIKLSFFTKENCPLCDEAKEILKELAKEIPIEIIEYDIYKDDQLLEKYQIMIPVIEMDGIELGFGRFEKSYLRKRLLEQMG